MSFARDLNSVLQIKLKQIFPITFHDEYSDKVVLHRYNEKDRPINQSKEKTYKYRSNINEALRTLHFKTFTCNEEDDTSTNESVESSDNNNDIQVNPFLPNVPFLYSLKTPENIFSRGIKRKRQEEMS